MSNIAEIRLAVLNAEIDAELADESLAHRKHGIISCYLKGGCRGPLCKYAKRIAGRTDKTRPYYPADQDALIARRLEEHHRDHEKEVDSDSLGIALTPRAAQA